VTTESRCVVVGVDFSGASRTALDHAIPLAVKLDAELLLFHAWNPTGWGTGREAVEAEAAWLGAARESTEAKLERWAETTREAGARAATRLEAGAASKLLGEAARRHRAELVVVGRTGHAGLAHVLLGSVSERVVSLAPCPVLVVPEEPETAEPPERLLVGIDFSSASRKALDAALRLASALETSRGLLLVHAYPGERELWLQNWSELVYRGKRRDDQAALEDWAVPARRSGISVEADAMEGQAETLLIEAARRTGCGWIVLGVHGRSALAARLIGSTADRVLKLADRPVLAVPPPTA
jgi:nucleotide-binding universal stress UspA family protein